MRKKMTRWLVILVIAASLPLFSGNQKTNDQEDVSSAKKSKKKTIKISKEILDNWDRAFYSKDLDNIIKYASQALKIYRQENHQLGEAFALFHIGWAYYKLRNYKKALEYLPEALKLSEKIGYKSGIANNYSTLGGIYSDLGDLEKAEENYLKALKISRELGNKKAVAVSIGNLGTVYDSAGKYDKALECHLEAVRIFEELNDKYGLSHSYSNLGTFYHDLKNFDKALEFHQKALRIAEETGEKEMIAHSLDNIGKLYGYSKKHKKALEYHMKALKISEELGDKKNLARINESIGLIYFFMNEEKMSLQYWERSLKIKEEMDDKWGIGNSWLMLGNNYNKKYDYEKALECYKKSLKIAREIKVKILENESYKAIATMYAAKNDCKNALKYFLLFHETDKALIDEQSRKQINELQTRYETEKKEKEVQLLKKNNEIQALKLNRQEITRNMLIIAFILVLIILVLLFRKYLYLLVFWKKQKYIGQFRLIEKIGSGGTGIIYQAQSIVDKSKIAAIKVLKEEFTNTISKQRFKREAAIIDKLEHPNIIKIFERGESKQRLFIAMEYLEGETLESKINQESRLTLKDSLHIMWQIADALAYIHGKNIIHRDLKPSNVMIVEKNGDPNFVKLLDFGLARMESESRLTQSGNLLGTLQYIAPEQIMSADSLPANDIFSLGVTFYQILCGFNPFAGETAIYIMRQIVSKEPEEILLFRPDIPLELNTLVMKMIDKRPGQRPSIESMRNALQHLIDHLPGS